MGRYIGARYVPLPDGAWDNTKEYEPLTMVQYEGDTYTSKMYVPVGIAITNTTYWVKTGNFNQQVSNLAQNLQQTDNRVQDIEGDVEDLQRDVAAIPDLFVVDSVFNEFTVAVGMTATGSITISKPGYKPLALRGWETSVFTLREVNIGTSAVSYTVTNNHETQTTGSLRVMIIFVKE